MAISASRLFQRIFTPVTKLFGKLYQTINRFIYSFTSVAKQEKKLEELLKPRNEVAAIYQELEGDSYSLFRQIQKMADDKKRNATTQGMANLILHHFHSEGVKKGSLEPEVDHELADVYRDKAIAFLGGNLQLNNQSKHYLSILQNGFEHAASYEKILKLSENSDNKLMQTFANKVLSFLYRKGFSRLGVTIEPDVAKADNYASKAKTEIENFESELESIALRLSLAKLYPKKASELLTKISNFSPQAKLIRALKNTAHAKPENEFEEIYEVAKNSEETPFAFKRKGLAIAKKHVIENHSEKIQSEFEECKLLFNLAKNGDLSSYQKLQKKSQWSAVANLQLGLLEISKYAPSLQKVTPKIKDKLLAVWQKLNAYFEKASSFSESHNLPLKDSKQYLTKMNLLLSEEHTDLIAKLTQIEQLASEARDKLHKDRTNIQHLSDYRQKLKEKLAYRMAEVAESIAMLDGTSSLQSATISKDVIKYVKSAIKFLNEISPSSSTYGEAQFRIAHLQRFFLKDFVNADSALEKLRTTGDTSGHGLESCIARDLITKIAKDIKNKAGAATSGDKLKKQKVQNWKKTAEDIKRDNKKTKFSETDFSKKQEFHLGNKENLKFFNQQNNFKKDPGSSAIDEVMSRQSFFEPMA